MWIFLENGGVKMKKIKITQEQAEAIEYAMNEKSKEFLLRRHGYVRFNNYDEFESELEPLNSLGTFDLARAMIEGYEVEPEFSYKDWVVFKGHKKDDIVTRIVEVEHGNDTVLTDYKIGGYVQRFPFEKIRHATPSEIAEEKERRWWRKHGRDVWSVEDGDIVRKKSDGFCFDVAVYSPEHFKENSELYEIACFWEDRLDVETNE